MTFPARAHLFLLEHPSNPNTLTPDALLSFMTCGISSDSLFTYWQPVVWTQLRAVLSIVCTVLLKSWNLLLTYNTLRVGIAGTQSPHANNQWELTATFSLGSLIRVFTLILSFNHHSSSYSAIVTIIITSKKTVTEKGSAQVHTGS